MHTHTQSIREIAIQRISEFLDETQIPAWQLGIRAVGNNKFWKHLRTGGEIKIGTLEKVEAFMATERARIAETVRMAEAETAEDYLEGVGEAARGRRKPAVCDGVASATPAALSDTRAKLDA